MSKRVNLEITCPDDSNLNVFTQPKRYLKDEYVRFFQDEIITTANDRDLNGTDLRVLMTILGNLDYDNKLILSHAKLGRQIGIKQQEVTKSFKKLLNKGYLEITGTIGRQNIYMFNPNVAFKSKAKNHKELKQGWDRKAMPNAQKYPIDTDTDLQSDLEDKLDDKVERLSKRFGVPQSKVRQIILSLVDQALNSDNKEEKELELPY
ncbi:MAG: replication/maintenance protein RepL [Crocosphaera sp.]|nr:replication/maintenance protein RepL [Crocosphaera sp.]